MEKHRNRDEVFYPLTSEHLYVGPKKYKKKTHTLKKV